MYLTVLGRWTEVLEYWQNASSPTAVVALAAAAQAPSQPVPPLPVPPPVPPMPPWPFERTFKAAFETFNLTMYNTKDPLKLPISDYYQTKTGITMDDSAETAATYWHLITQGGAAQPNGATAICSAPVRG